MAALVARDIMNPVVVQLERGSSAADAARIMTEKHVGCVVITASGYPVGIMTETDIVRLVASDANLHATKIEDIMSSPLFSVAPDGEILAIATTMSSNHIKKMPVVERQQVVGMITQTDVVKYAVHAIEEIHQEYSEGKLSAMEFSRRTAELFLSVPRIPDAIKHWHMRCRGCGFRFLVDEQEGGKLSIEQCPRCTGAIMYDPAPPL